MICKEFKGLEKDLLEVIETINKDPIVDSYIKEELIELNKLGVVTLYSCSGHVARRHSYIMCVVSDRVFRELLKFMDEEASMYLTLNVKPLDRIIDPKKEGLRHAKRIPAVAKNARDRLLQASDVDGRGRCLVIEISALAIARAKQGAVDGDDVPWMFHFREAIRNIISFLRRVNNE